MCSGVGLQRTSDAHILCNEVFYTEMEWAQKTGKIAGFIHIPLATSMIADKVDMYRFPHMSLDLIEKACTIVVKEVKRTLDPTL